MSPLDFDVFSLLLKARVPLTLNEIASELGRDKSTAFRSVQRMHAAGLCDKKVKNLRDGGYYHVYLAADPKTIRKQTLEKVDQIQQGINRLLQRIEKDMDEIMSADKLEVLVAEDDIYIAIAYKKALQQRGHNVTIASDGIQCLETYTNQTADGKPRTNGEGSCNRFDVVILDYRIPGIDGMQVAKRILESNPEQRIIFASAYVRETLVEAVKSLNQAVEVIQKPFELDELISLVENVQAHRRLRRLFANKPVADGDINSRQMLELFESFKRIQRGDAF
jgi:predicted transcriptional regulator/DNA-binding response OmpR family regulator